jgi:hypothetical protein
LTDKNDPITLDDLHWLPDELVEFAAAWRRWRGDQLLPRRSNVKRKEISRILPRVMVLEVISPDEARFRLVGTSYLEIFGVELTGLNFVNLVPPEDREVRGGRLLAMVNTPCGSYMATPDPNTSSTGNVLHTLSLPVLPNIPDKPMQFFGITFGTKPMQSTSKYGADLLKNLADRFTYIDIGAGLPNIA